MTPLCVFLLSLIILHHLPGVNSRSARVLFLLVAPGHLVFLYTINSLRGGHTTLTSIFITFYLAAALLQVRVHSFIHPEEKNVFRRK